MSSAELQTGSVRYSFVIPSYNYASFLSRAVASVCDQIAESPRACEVILIDDGSTDNTKDVAADLCREYPFLRYVYQANTGVSGARNHGATLATGEYLWFVDADDQLLDGAIDAMDEALQQHPHEAMIFGGYRSHTTDGRRVEKFWSGGELSFEQSFLRCITGNLTGLCIGSSILRRDVFLRYLFPTNVQNGEDFILYAHIIVNEGFSSIAQILINTYRHEGSLRSNLATNEETGFAGTDCLFDPDRIPQELMRLKPRYIANRHVGLARLYYIAKDYDQVKSHYRQALAVYPLSLLELSHLRKYLRALIFG
jgi:glycosyltransferase involved in cell wall biosynthesis